MKIKIISLFLIFAIFIIIAVGIYMIHTYPGKVAKKKKHPQQRAIEVTSLTGLIFFPLWILALIWAHSNAVLGILYNKGDFGDEAPPESNVVELPTSETKTPASDKEASKKETNKPTDKK